MDPIDSLAEYFKKFPGIGERQARRFVYHLLKQSQSSLDSLAGLISSIKKEVAQCPSCFISYRKNGKNICAACGDPSADSSLLLVVEKDADYENIRQANFYKGRYFILGGLVPIVEKDTEKRVRVRELLGKVEKENPKEIILAMSLSPQGEHTDMYLRQALSPLREKIGFTLTSLGRGLSTGLELEYSDPETLKNALKNRG